MFEIFERRSGKDRRDIGLIKVELFGVQFLSWWPVAWLVFGFFGAVVWAGMVSSGFNPKITQIWVALGICHWPVGFLCHVLIQKQVSLNRNIWNQNGKRFTDVLPSRNAFLVGGFLVSTLTVISQVLLQEKPWAIVPVYIFGTIKFAYWAKTQPRPK